MTAKEIQQYVYDFFYNKKLPHIVICSIMGNITGESSWNPDAIEKGSGIGFGLCQWSYGRRTTLEAYGTSLKHQCEFLWSELTGKNTSVTGASYQWIANPADSVDNGEGFYCSNADFLAGNGTIDFLTKAFCYCWERPAYATNHLTTTRIPSANSFNTTMKYSGSTAVWIRIEKPESGNPFYNTTGYSTCIKGKYNSTWATRYQSYGYNIISGSSAEGYNVLPNCVGLANGAFNESYVKTKQLSDSNFVAKQYYALNCNANQFIVRAQELGLTTRSPSDRPPKGGIIVYGNGANHVAFITEVIDDDTIEIIQSGWGGWNGNWGDETPDPVWPLRPIRSTRRDGWPCGDSSCTNRCIGFVVNPAIPDDSNVVPEPPVVTKYGAYIGGQFYGAYIYNGTSWKKATPKIYNGTKWVNCSE